MKGAARSLLLALFLVASAGACAGGMARSGAPPADARVIAGDEIRATNVENAYELVRSLRPQWMRTRGQQSIHHDPGIRVYLDNTALGSLDALRQLHPQNIESIRFLDAAAANYRFGTGHTQGAIVVISRFSR